MALKNFPVIVRKVGSWIGSIKKYFRDIQSSVDEVTSIEEKGYKENKNEQDKTNKSSTLIDHLTELFKIIKFFLSFS